MSIRIRKVGDELIALCAARSVPKDGDVYLDDAQHHALARKFESDFASEGFYSGPVDAAREALTESQESSNSNRDRWDKVYANS